MNSTPRVTTLLSTLALGVALGLQPLSLYFASLDVGLSQAHAKNGDGGNGGGNGGNGGGGGGNGGGNGGGHGGGNGNGGDRADRGGSGGHGGSGHGGHGGSHANGGGGRGNGSGSGLIDAIRDAFTPDQQRGKSAGNTSRDRQTASINNKGKAPQARDTSVASRDKAKDKASRTDRQTASVPAPAPVPTDKKASLGRLNAAHASQTAMKNAAANSTVGRIAAYQAAVTGDEIDIDAAAAALVAASNKPVTAERIEALNDILGITFDDESTVKEIADAAERLQNPGADAAAANSTTSTAN